MAVQTVWIASSSSLLRHHACAPRAACIVYHSCISAAQRASAGSTRREQRLRRDPRHDVRAAESVVSINLSAGKCPH
eukprot:6206468-Pleurochrysis_carterae.AAC.3